MPHVLAGDIGGTKTLLAIAEVTASSCHTLYRQHYPSADYADFQPMLADFLAAAPPEVRSANIAAVCLGVAGPVRYDGAHQTAQITNLPWKLDNLALADYLQAPTKLINDFEAIGYGIGALAPIDLVTLQAGKPEIRGTRAVLGAGTGLGLALLIWRSGNYRIVPSEGGHADFAPFDAQTGRLWQTLSAQLGRVSDETVLSGRGLERIFAFLQADTGQTPSAALQTALSSATDPAAVISQFALNHTDPLATAALTLFVQIYGALAGNFALTAKASGGLYLAGGIAAKILPVLQTDSFLQTFLAKSPMTLLLTQIPVSVVRTPDVGLLGAAWVAGQLMTAAGET